jgi:hypothetical protein
MYDTIKKENKAVEFLIYLILILVKFGYFKFKYYPILDDWIQYGSYPLYDNIFYDVILRVGTYTTRPLASLSDPYVWGSFWPYMGIAFFIITLLHFLSYILIYKILKFNGIETGPILFIIFCLMPLGTEASYWLSASTRIVVGIFFMSLSLYLLCIFIESKRKVILLLFTIVNLISFCYYEQVTVLSFVCTVLLIFFNRRRVNNKVTFFVPFINITIIGGYYKLFSTVGNVSQRGQVVNENYFSHMIEGFDKITDVWGQVHIPLLINGLKRGIEILTNGYAIIYFIIIILFSILLAQRLKRLNNHIFAEEKIILLIIGIILFWVPYIPILLMDNIWICNRNVFTSFIGLGFAIEAIISLIPENNIWYTLKKIGITIIVSAFLIINVSELNDYKSISENDKIISEGIINNIDDKEFFNGSKKVILFNTKNYYSEQNSFFHDHILNITSSDWALTGGVRAETQNMNIKYLTPIKNGEEIYEFYDAVLLGIEDNLNIEKLYVTKNQNKNYELYGENDTIFGIIENGIFYKE